MRYCCLAERYKSLPKDRVILRQGSSCTANYLCDFMHVRARGWCWQHVCPKLQQFSPDHTASLLKRQKPTHTSEFHLFCSASASDVTVRCNDDDLLRYCGDTWFLSWADYRKVWQVFVGFPQSPYGNSETVVCFLRTRCS